MSAAPHSVSTVPAGAPQRVRRALAGFFPGLASANQFSFEGVPPRRVDGNGGGSRRGRPRITFHLPFLDFCKSLIVRPLQQATEFPDYPFGDVPNLDPGFRAFLALPHGNNHEGLECGLPSENQKTIREQHTEKFFGVNA